MIDFLLSVISFPWLVFSTVFIYAFGVGVYLSLYVVFRVYLIEPHGDSVRHWWQQGHHTRTRWAETLRSKLSFKRNKIKTHKTDDIEEYY